VAEIKNIIIVGGGTAGFMTAASLLNSYAKANIKITLVESSKIGTIGVGEATIPTIRAFYNELGISDAEIIARTGASAKLGIQFNGWKNKDSSFIHPFGDMKIVAVQSSIRLVLEMIFGIMHVEKINHQCAVHFDGLCNSPQCSIVFTPGVKVAEAGKKVESVIEVIDPERLAHIVYKKLQLIMCLLVGCSNGLCRNINAGYIKTLL